MGLATPTAVDSGAPEFEGGGRAKPFAATGERRPLGPRDFAAPRDLLPLPHVAPRDRWHGPRHGGRRLSQRVARAARLHDDVNQTIDALNWCFGCSSPSTSEPTAAQAEAIAHLFEVHRSEAPPAPDNTAQAAVEELLGGFANYGMASCAVAPYDEALVSIPSPGSSPTPLESVLPDDARECLMRFGDRMLLDDTSWGEITQNEEAVHIKPYMDERLKGDAALYASFVAQLLEAGLVRFGRRSQTIVTPFFVNKKNGRLRLVLDCRPANRCFRVPPMFS